MQRKKKFDIIDPPIEFENNNDDGKTYTERQQERLINLKQNLQDALLNPDDNKLYIQDLRDSIKVIGG